jgi:peptide/nickel transport system substrate-binding protein
MRIGKTVIALVVVALTLASAHAQAPKRGGILNAMQPEDLPAGFNIHETATIVGLWPAMSCYSNLVLFDPARARESPESIVPELAERWSWQDGYRNLVFFLRKNVKWHDGAPFTAADVKYTFDVIREAPAAGREAKDASARLRVNARKEWYSNVESIETSEPYTVIFKLKRPQPSLLTMLASGYSPVYPAHVPLATLRQKCVGTGPFRLKQYVPGQVIEMERNPDYFVRDRPYLDGIRYVIITERGTRLAALQAGQLDVSIPTEMTKVMAEQVKSTAPRIVITERPNAGSDNVVVNHKRAPFDNVQVRRAINMALDRRAWAQGVRHGGATPSSAFPPRPHGLWGLSASDLATYPGFRDPARDKADARRLLTEAGYGPGKPLRAEVATRTWGLQVDLAVFVQDQLRQVGIETTLKQMESAVWYPALARRDFTIAANLTAVGVDDPDALLYEQYKCGSLRNVSDYCNPEVDRMIEQQSQELDAKKRLALVLAIQKKLEEDVAKPMLGWRNDYFAMWPHVRNLVPHYSIYNWGRMQDVWLDR